MKILLFGNIAEKIGSSQIFLENIENTQHLKEKLYEKYPFLKDMIFSIIIDRKTLQEDTPLLPHQEIALLPPFSGG